MMQLIDHSCPDVTCEAFRRPFTVESWDYDEQEYGEGQEGEPICEDDLDCRQCGSHCPRTEEVEDAFTDLLDKIHRWPN